MHWSVRCARLVHPRRTRAHIQSSRSLARTTVGSQRFEHRGTIHSSSSPDCCAHVVGPQGSRPDAFPPRGQPTGALAALDVLPCRRRRICRTIPPQTRHAAAAA
ncbi:hypothetical protein WOLCODRAFT_27693 [Wolfiporia cocos MD-104 SS10]|uniref:Uncharacterized protein n=1 Tax=Wolfiporia cocos (strain MD-104) TaxID=742152 RepID=A0A2H3J5Y6_WOLCO|nr:hypothetical protein WOLCODRAFT_27693 [Wolfiporia cocos MD-104 SS10]